MIKEKILVIGASGQIGVELTLALRKVYGDATMMDHLVTGNEKPPVGGLGFNKYLL